ncbi:di-N-acetylchitobiase-like [Narcine bancroftii]|uniref:di-N-acetylchitobiase-like n=1 Tax=Narcine bancroftii TaxID=1343680 RepID=UPI0038312552
MGFRDELKRFKVSESRVKHCSRQRGEKSEMFSNKVTTEERSLHQTFVVTTHTERRRGRRRSFSDVRIAVKESTWCCWISISGRAQAGRMCWSSALILVLVLLDPLSMGRSSRQTPYGCRCVNPALCQPLGPDVRASVQVVAIDFGGKDWKHYDWAKVTTIVLTRDVDPELVCYAHAKDIRVVTNVQLSMHDLRDHTARKNWIRNKIYLTTTNFLDGINVNLFTQFAKESESYYELNQLIEDLVETLHGKVPGSQVSVTLPWSPDCTDGQCCDYLNISRTCDFVFVRSYNIPQDMRYGCIAHPPAPYHQVLSGLSAFIRLGIDSRKLVMGVPWYGYDYTCQHFVEAGNCELVNVSVDEIACSYLPATRLHYKDIMNLLPRSITGRIWDDIHKTPYFMYMNGSQYHEVWYDDPESISMRATFLKKLKLGGIGVWTVNSLNYSGDARTWIQTEEMWNALCPP